MGDTLAAKAARLISAVSSPNTIVPTVSLPIAGQGWVGTAPDGDEPVTGNLRTALQTNTLGDLKTTQSLDNVRKMQDAVDKAPAQQYWGTP